MGDEATYPKMALCSLDYTCVDISYFFMIKTGFMDEISQASAYRSSERHGPEKQSYKPMMRVIEVSNLHRM